jgi:hypothetical protein
MSRRILPVPAPSSSRPDYRWAPNGVIACWRGRPPGHTYRAQPCSSWAASRALVPVRPCSPRPDAPSRHRRQLPAARRIGKRSGASSDGLGPHWVRVGTDAHGRGRAPTVAIGPEEPQLTRPSGSGALASRYQASAVELGPNRDAEALMKLDRRRPAQRRSGRLARRCYQPRGCPG